MEPSHWPESDILKRHQLDLLDLREDNEHLQTTRVYTDKGDFAICLQPREAVSTADVVMKKHKPKLRKPFINHLEKRDELSKCHY